MGDDRLGEYRARRDFEATPEPRAGSEVGGGPPRFVIQEHHARRLHWDFRLERDGVLVSWALPRGVPPDRSPDRLAVPTEDHPLSYIDFAGQIPRGSYGAGTVSIWDRGTYDCHKWEEREVIVTLHGERVRGKHALFRTGERRWMIHRMDPPEDTSREPVPESIEPMLATLSARLPRDDGEWSFEVKWDGVRAVAYAEGGRLRLHGRNGTDFTAQFPELGAMAESVAPHALVLDGEVVALDDEGRADFARLQPRIHGRSGRRGRDAVPVTYLAFDLLYLDGRSTLELPYSERRRLLEDLSFGGPRWQTPGSHAGDGERLLAASRERGLEGLVAKRRDSPYEPGRRSRHWLKVKNVARQELVVGGWMPGEGGRGGRIGSLLVGYYESGSLRYAGRVGSGLGERDLAALRELMKPLARDSSPFVPPPALPREVARRGAFVEPAAVVDVQFAEWTASGTLRAPVFKGLRRDADPRGVTREVPS